MNRSLMGLMITYFSSLNHTLRIVPKYCILLFGMNLYRVVFSGELSDGPSM